MKIRVTKGEAHKIRRDPASEDPQVTYYVEFYTQPWYRVLVYQIYHAYDMNKIVHWIFHRLPDKKVKVGQAYRRNAPGGEWIPVGPAEDIMGMPRCAKQDVRCHRLSYKGRKDLARMTVPKETYDALRLR